MSYTLAEIREDVRRLMAGLIFPGSIEAPGAWVDWVPTYTSLTIGNGTVAARYTRIGNTIHAYWSIVFGTTTSVAAGLAISAPVAGSVSPNQENTIGTVMVFDAAPVARYNGFVMYESGLLLPRVGVASCAYLTNTFIGGGNPILFATNDSVALSVTYEAA